MILKDYCTKFGAESAFNAISKTFDKKQTSGLHLTDRFHMLSNPDKNKWFSLNRVLLVAFLEQCKSEGVKLEDIKY